MKTIIRSFIAVACVMLIGCTSTRDSESIWRARIKQVHVGMPRVEVERLLPPDESSSRSATGTASAYRVSYRVDPQWRVIIWYDYTGLRRNKTGDRIDDLLSTDAGKVLSIPTLVRK